MTSSLEPAYAFTDRSVRLAPFQAKHLLAIGDLALYDDFSAEFAASLLYFREAGDGGEWLARIERQRQSGAAEAFVAEAAGHVVGTLYLGGMLAPESCHLSYWIARPFRGRGYATAAGRLAIAFAYSGPRLRQSVHAFVYETNVPSRRVLEKLRFSPCGSIGGGRLCFEHVNRKGGT